MKILKPYNMSSKFKCQQLERKTLKSAENMAGAVLIPGDLT